MPICRFLTTTWILSQQNSLLVTAGVCILTAFFPNEAMQKIAAENRHSETAFIVPRADGDFDLRWFTPKVEDDLRGHATLASAYVRAIRGQRAWSVRFHSCSGVLTVTRAEDTFEMDLPNLAAETLCAATRAAAGALPQDGTSHDQCRLCRWVGSESRQTV